MESKRGIERESKEERKGCIENICELIKLTVGQKSHPF